LRVVHFAVPGFGLELRVESLESRVDSLVSDVWCLMFSGEWTAGSMEDRVLVVHLSVPCCGFRVQGLWLDT